MEYKVISADCHIDIPWLPADLFVLQAPNKLKERMPRVVDTKEGRQWIAEGQPLAWVAGAGLTGAWGPYVRGESRRLDRMEEEGRLFSDGQNGLFHPTTPEIVSAVGEDSIMWGSDYPHPDSVFPDSRTVIQNDLTQLDEGVRRKIVCENAAKLYGFK